MSRRDKDGESIARIIARGFDAMSEEDDDRLDVALAIWADYQAKLPSNKKIRKPKTHAAGVHYATSKLLDLSVTQKKISRQYHVSTGKVSKMYRIIWDRLSLRRDDPRYASAALAGNRSTPASSTTAKSTARATANARSTTASRGALGATDDFDPVVLESASREELLLLVKNICESSIHARQIARKRVSALSLEERLVSPERSVDSVLDALVFDGEVLAKPLAVFLEQEANAIGGALERSFDQAATQAFAQITGALARKSLEVTGDHMQTLLEHAKAFFVAVWGHVETCTPETRRAILVSSWLELLWSTRTTSIHWAHTCLNSFVSRALESRASRALFEAWYPKLELDRVEVRALMSRAIASSDEHARMELRTLWERHARDCIAKGAHETLMRMAKAFTHHDAELAIEILEELASHHIDKKTRKHYELAALTLVELRSVFAVADLELGWGDFFSLLEETTKSREALHEEFARHGLSA